MHVNSQPPSDRNDHSAEPRPATTTASPVQDAFARHIKDRGLTRKQAGAKIGMSDTTVTLYLQGNYEGDVEKLERKIAEYLDNESRRSKAGVATIECEQTKEIRTCLELIRKTNDVGVILGESGEGKTRGIEHYRLSNPNCVLFPVREWTSDKSSVEGALLTAVGTGDYKHMEKRADYLTRKLAGSDRLLIVDDAHKLTRPALQWLFDFHDATGIPMALIGTFKLQSKLSDDPQRFRRVGYRYELKPETPEALIEHLVKTFAPEASAADAKVLKALSLQVSEHRGHFGDVHKQLKLAAEIKSAAPMMSWENAFRAAHKNLFRDFKLN